MSTLLIIILVVTFLFFTGISLLIGVVIWLGREKGSKEGHAENQDHDDHPKKEEKKGPGWHCLWIIPLIMLIGHPLVSWGLRIMSPPPPKTLQWSETTWSATYYDKEGFVIDDSRSGDWFQIIEMSNTSFIARYRDNGEWYYYRQTLGGPIGTHYNEKTGRVVEEFWVLRGEYFPFTTKQIVLMTKSGEKIVFRAREQALDKNMFLGEKNRPRL